MTRILDTVINDGEAIVSGTHTAASTTITLLAGERAKLPDITDNPCNLVWYLASKYDRPKDDPNAEIVRYTATSSTNDIVVTRAQEGTTATAKNLSSTGYRLVSVLTAKMIDDIEKNLSKLKTTYVVGPAGSGVEYECDGTDDHVQIQEALDAITAAGGGTLKILKGTYDIDAVDHPLLPTNNTEIIMDEGCTLQARTTNNGTYEIIMVDDRTGVKISGGRLLGDKDTHTGTDGQWGFGIKLAGSSDVKIDKVRFEKFWGDGIYVARSSQQYALDTEITNCIFDDNRRQGISVISAKNLLIDTCIFKNTSGQNPEAGIDFEPNLAFERLENINVNNIVTENNSGAGLWFALQNLDATSVPVSININNINSKTDKRGLYFYGNNGARGYINIDNIIITETEKGAVEIRNWKGVKLTINNVEIIDCNTSAEASAAYGSAISIHKEVGDTGVGTLGDVSIINPSIVVTGSYKPSVVFFIRNYVDLVTENINIINPINVPDSTDTLGGAVMSNGSGCTNFNILDEYKKAIRSPNGNTTYPSNIFSVIDTSAFTSSRTITLASGIDTYGCFEIYSNNASGKNVIIAPDSADYINGLGLAEKLTSNGKGYIKLRKVDSTQWIIEKMSGIWENEDGFDINSIKHEIKTDHIYSETDDGYVSIEQPSDNIGLYINSLATTATKFGFYSHCGSGANASRFLSDAECYTDIARHPSDTKGSNRFYRKLDSTLTGCPVVYMSQEHSTDDKDVLSILQSGTGKVLFIDQNRDNYGIHIDSEATTKAGLQIDMANVAYVGFNTNGLIQGVNVTSGSDPGHTHTAYETAGVVSTHASLQTGIHGISITAGKTFSCTGILTLAGTDSSTLNIGTGGTLGTAAYTATTAYEASGAIATHAALLTGVHGLSITAGKVLTVQDNVTITGALGTGAYATIANYLPLAGGTMTGNLLFTDNTYDIGASGATRPRTLYLGTSLEVAPDTDAVVTLGTAKIGYNGTSEDVAAFAHFDNMSLSNAALYQVSAGDTIVNCKTGRTVYLRINNATIAKITSTGFEPSADNTRYLGRNDDDTPNAWKGLILADQSNSKYYRIEMINGVITATDLTD